MPGVSLDARAVGAWGTPARTGCCILGVRAPKASPLQSICTRRRRHRVGARRGPTARTARLSWGGSQPRRGCRRDHSHRDRDVAIQGESRDASCRVSAPLHRSADRHRTPRRLVERPELPCGGPRCSLPTGAGGSASRRSSCRSNCTGDTHPTAGEGISGTAFELGDWPYGARRALKFFVGNTEAACNRTLPIACCRRSPRVGVSDLRGVGA